MILIIYELQHGQPKHIEQISSQLTVETYDINVTYKSVVQANGGINSDYKHLWIENDERVFTHYFTILDGNLEFGSEMEPQKKEPSLDDYLIELDFRLSTIELGL